MTKAKWIELTPKQQWDVMVALRGPDCHRSEPLKWLTTAVLRGQMLSVMRMGGTINEDLQCIVIPTTLTDDEPEGEGLHWSPCHFFHHVIEGARVCEIPICTIPNTTYYKAVTRSSNNPMKAVYRVWRHLDGKKTPLSTLDIYLHTELARHVEKLTGKSPKEYTKLYQFGGEEGDSEQS